MSGKPCIDCGVLVPANPKGYWRCGDCHRAKRRAWRAQHRDEINAYFREYYQRHPDRNTAWRRENAEKVREYGRRYARKARAEGRGSYATFDRGTYLQSTARFAIYDKHGGICWLCNEPVARNAFHLDHVVPVAKGGPTADWNLRPAHPRCNREKSDSLIPFELNVTVYTPPGDPPEEWAEAIGDLDISPGKARLIDGRWLVVDCNGNMDGVA